MKYGNLSGRQLENGDKPYAFYGRFEMLAFLAIYTRLLLATGNKTGKIISGIIKKLIPGGICMEFGLWLDKWLYYIQPAIKESTLNHYDYFMTKIIKPALGNYELEDLNLMVLQNFVTNLSRLYSPLTIKNIVSLVRRSLEYAEEFDLINTSISGKIRYKCKMRPSPKYLSQADQKKIECYINNIRSPKLYGIIICLYTGIRVGELMALEWSDIDFKTGILHINKTCHDSYGENGYLKIIDTPKTLTSKRDIPIPKPLLALLKEQKKRNNSKFVISNHDGNGISIRSYQNTFDILLKKLNLPHMGIHGLRHTFATRALERGMDIKTLSEILGHSNATITLNIYAHSQAEHKRAMMDKLGKLLETT